MDYVTATAIVSLSMLVIGMTLCLARLLGAIDRLNQELMRD